VTVRAELVLGAVRVTLPLPLALPCILIVAI
jgi:hypothetical protein